MSRKGRRAQAQCVYCGQMAVCTKEHVIPRGFYPQDSPRPSNAVIVSACSTWRSSEQRNQTHANTSVDFGDLTLNLPDRRFLWHVFYI